MPKHTERMNKVYKLEDEIEWLRGRLDTLDAEGYEYAKLLCRVEELEYRLHELLEG